MGLMACTRFGGVKRAAAALLAGLVLALAPMSATAQEDEKPKTLFDLLFKKQSSAKPKAKTQADQAKPAEKRQRNKTKPKTAPAASTPPKPEPVVKLPDAKAVLVVGDFFAAGAAGGLTEAYEQAAGVRIVDAAKGDSGLVRDDFYNWPLEIGALIDTHKPAAVVVMIGANDRQTMTLGGVREAVRSPAWTLEYRARVQALAAAVTSRRIPLVWIGQLPMRAQAVNADMLALNDIYRDASDNARVGASFVDVWEGFVDETGKFMDRGPDINGQTATLRVGQVNVTRVGFRKIAFYAEKALSRVLGDPALASAAGPLGDINLPALTLGLPNAGASLERMRPFELTDPDIHGGDVLLGEVVAPDAALPAAGEAPAGRIDDFRLPALRR